MPSEKERRELRERCERDLYFLCKRVLGFGFLDQEFHKEFCKETQSALHSWTGKDNDPQWNGMLAPRGFGKTTLRTVGGVIQAELLGGIDGKGKWREPHFTQGICHAKDELSQNICKEVRSQWENNDTLKWIASDLAYKNPERESPVWTASSFTLKRPTFYRVPSVVAFSPEASTVGMHFDIIWNDDTVIDTNSENAEQRAKILQFIKSQLALLKKIGWRRMMCTGTHWDVDDAWAAMRDPNGDFGGNARWVVYKARQDDGTLLWPDRFPEEVLQKEERALGPYKFSCLYQNDPQPEGIASFEYDFVQRYTAEYDEKGQWIPPDPERGYWILMAVDPNTTEDTAHDPACVTTAAWDSAGCIWVIDVAHGHPSPSQLIEWIREGVVRYQPKVILYEDVQAQKQAFHWMEKDTLINGVRFPLQPVKRGPKLGKYMRIMALSPLIRSKGLWVPNGAKFHPMMEEIRKYSKRAKRDDCLDTLADIYSMQSKPSAPQPVVQSPSDPYLLSRLVKGRPDRMLGGATEGSHGALESIYR